MSFLRKATLQFKQIYASDNNGKYYWRDTVKEANKILATDKNFLPKEAFEYDTKNFLYIKSRAISGMEKHGCNGNGDAFPWEELLKSFPSFVGKGFYIEHIEDSDEDAKGIILDAEPVMEEEYINCLSAIDKNEYPEICQKIIDGELNQVSMSCLASEAECSCCHNVARSSEELCEHMNPKSRMTYCKNCKDLEGNTIYEINRDIVFTGLSGVAVPADKDAFIFDIKASKKKSNNLKQQFDKYIRAKYLQAGAMKNLQQEIKSSIENESMENIISNVSITLSNVLQQLLNNEQDHAQCNLAAFASTLNDIARCKFMLESCIEMNKKQEEIVVSETPIVEEKTIPEQEEIKTIESKKEDNKQEVSCECCKKSNKKIRSSKKSFWTKL